MTKRNQPCPCGSNIKYKKCCGATQTHWTSPSSNADQQSPVDIQNNNSIVQELSPKDNLALEEARNNPESAQAHYNLGYSYIERNMLEEAVACFKKTLSLQPAAEVYYNLAIIQERLGCKTEAIDNFQEALLLKPDLSAVYTPLGNLYLKTNNFKEAITCYNKALADDKSQAETYNNLGVALKNTNQLWEAADNFRKALSLKTDYDEAYVNLGVVLSELGKPEEAIDCYQQALSLNPLLSEAYVNLGNSHKEQMRYEEAIDCFVKSLSIAPNNSNTLNNLGLIYFKQRRYVDAAGCLTKSLSIAPNDPSTLNNLGLTYFKQRRYVDAVGCFTKSLSIAPNHPRALTDLGIIYRKQRRFNEAYESFHKAISIDPEYYRAMHNQGLANQEQGRYEVATECFQKVLSKNPKYVNTLSSLGVINIGQEKLEDAVSYFNKALAIKPDFQLPHIYLTIIYWINGDLESCKNHLDHLSNNKMSDEEDPSFVAPYLELLKKLLKHRESNSTQYTKNANLPILYAVGDSHCLSLANTKVNFKGIDYHVEAKIVIGCKAWHVGNKDNNSYKYEFEKRINSIPSGAPTLLMFGEIDCRIQEGIIRHYKMNHVNLTESIVSLVDNYLNYTLRIVTARNISPIICNIPTQDVVQYVVSDSDKNLQKEVLATFNQALRDHAYNKRIPLLDVYHFSKTPKDCPDNKYHIDGVHLWPSVYEHLFMEL